MNYLFKNWFKPVLGLLSLTLLAITATGCGAEETTTEKQEAIPVEVLTASTTMSRGMQQFPGRVASDNEANLSTIVMGTVTSVPVTVGEKVHKGEVLVRIKDDQILAQKSQLEANMVQAKANLENTEKNYNRIKNLYAEESATSKEMDDISTMYEIAKANMEALEARLHELNEMLAYTTIRAPFDGVVARKFVSEGDMAAPGHPLVAVADPSSVKITANVPEQWISNISEGAKVWVNVESAEVENLSATLTAVSEAGDPMSRQFAIEARLDEKDGTEALKTGMFAQIAIQVDGSNALYIPKKALVERGQLTGVYTLNDDDKAMLRWVRTGQSYADSVEIISGLQNGEQFVADARQSIRQGQQLRIQ